MGHPSISSSHVGNNTTLPNDGDELKKRINGTAKAATNACAHAGEAPPTSNPLKKIGLYEPVYNVNLEEYTRTFKGDTVFGVEFKAPLKWDKVIQIFLVHIVSIVCLICFPLQKLNIYTTLWAFFMGGVAGFGVTAGAHRFWTHRSFKANVALRSILMICFSTAGQNTLYDWVRDHRVHHKYSETDADPHNSNRGFFFAHVGWLMMLKHPEVLRRGRQLDMSDVMNDPVVQFHQKYFIPLKILLCFVLPTIVPMYFWGEEFHLAFITQCLFRYVSSLNFTWSVNSAAHMFGTRPYDNRIKPTENIYVSIIAMGEGWHNYHHVFPWDYKAAELGNYVGNFTTMVLDAFHRIGWAWDMKEPSKDLVRRVIDKYGDGTHPTTDQTTETTSVGNFHYAEVPDPEFEGSDAESSSTESTKLDENENMKKKVQT
ncbi:acyl-CoA Delta-9 desaturase [Zeugodacus cucurbitae]|uniref:Acyl-CoA Delta(11) desaturase n=1 Tax=Zeugodacus cucurbitae TaxID=28588 RepID=A0A0A1X4V7_ZEUCU|nr:acyl-CoA Delta-9 desaturase [Zeugodacus cucurbitae]